MHSDEPGPLEARIDGLFRLDLREFTGARDALAAELRKARLPEEARRVKALAKPTVSAWAVNQLAIRARGTMEELGATGAAVRRAQGATLAGGPVSDLHAAQDARRRVVARLLSMAAEILAAAGHATTASTMQRVALTLESVSSAPSPADGPVAGRLTSDLGPTGFDALSDLAAALPAPASAGAPLSPPAPEPAAEGPDPEIQAAEAEVARRAAAREARAGALQAARADAEGRDRRVAELEKALAAARAERDAALADLTRLRGEDEAERAPDAAADARLAELRGRPRGGRA